MDFQYVRRIVQELQATHYRMAKSDRRGIIIKSSKCKRLSRFDQKKKNRERLSRRFMPLIYLPILGEEVLSILMYRFHLLFSFKEWSELHMSMKHPIQTPPPLFLSISLSLMPALPVAQRWRPPVSTDDLKSRPIWDCEPHISLDPRPWRHKIDFKLWQTWFEVTVSCAQARGGKDCQSRASEENGSEIVGDGDGAVGRINSPRQNKSQPVQCVCFGRYNVAKVHLLIELGIGDVT